MSNVFRKEYKTLSPEVQNVINEIKDEAEKLYTLFEKESSRELSLAKTKLEEAIFWITKHFTS